MVIAAVSAITKSLFFLIQLPVLLSPDTSLLRKGNKRMPICSARLPTPSLRIASCPAKVLE